METVVQFLRSGDSLMARGHRHLIRHVCRDGERREVTVIGHTDDDRYFEAQFKFGETVDTLD